MILKQRYQQARKKILKQRGIDKQEKKILKQRGTQQASDAFANETVYVRLYLQLVY